MPHRTNCEVSLKKSINGTNKIRNLIKQLDQAPELPAAKSKGKRQILTWSGTKKIIQQKQKKNTYPQPELDTLEIRILNCKLSRITPIIEIEGTSETAK